MTPNYNLHKYFITFILGIYMLRFKQFILEFQQLLENRIGFLKQNFEGKLNTNHDPYGVHKTTNDIVDHFSTNADPTKNKSHTQWILKQYQQGRIRQEDHPRIKEALSNFEQHKGKLANRDINSYKSLSDIEDAIKPHLGTPEPVSKRQETKKIKEEGSEVIHSSPNLTVRKLKTKEAACHYGAGTQWCTAARENNMFDSYNQDGPLYVIHHKDENDNERKYQYHPASDQFMDEQDNPVGMHSFVGKYPEIKSIKAFQGYHQSIPLTKEHREELSDKFHKLIDDKNLRGLLPKEKIDEILSKQVENAAKRGHLDKSHLDKLTADESIPDTHESIALLTNHLHDNHIANIARSKGSSGAHDILARDHHDLLQHGNRLLSDEDIHNIMKNPESGGAHTRLLRSHGIYGNILKPEHIDSIANDPTNSYGHQTLVTSGAATPEHIDTIINNPRSSSAHTELFQRHLDKDSIGPKLSPEQFTKVLKRKTNFNPFDIPELAKANKEGRISLEDHHVNHILNNIRQKAALHKFAAHAIQGDFPFSDENRQLLRQKVAG